MREDRERAGGRVAGALAATAVVIGLASAACDGGATGPAPAVPTAVSTSASGVRVPTSRSPEPEEENAVAALGASDVDAGGAVSPSVSFTGPDGNELTVDEGLFLVDRVRLVPKGVGECGSGECVVLAENAVLFEVPLSSELTRQLTAQIPADRYVGIEMRLHVTTAADSVVVDSFPEMEGASALVRGTYNGQSFAWRSDAVGTVGIQLQPELDVADSPPAGNVTLRPVVSTWFRADDQSIMDPAGGQGTVAGPDILSAFTAFADIDGDGEPDRESPTGGS